MTTKTVKGTCSMPRSHPKLTPSVERTLSLLELLAESKGSLTLSEMSRKLKAPRSSIHAICATLERRSYLARLQRYGGYRLGSKVIWLGQVTIRNLELVGHARPSLTALMRKTGLSVHLAVMDEDEAVQIEKIPALRLILKDPSWVGLRASPHCNGVGKAMLAFLPQDEFERRFSKKSLSKYNRQAITSIATLSKELTKIRRLGYSLSDQEIQIGYRGIGAPVLDDDGQLLAGISVNGTIDDITLDRVPALGRLVKQCAHNISIRLAQK